MASPSDHSTTSITSRSFAVRRKGFDPDEVRAYLGQLAEVVSRLTSERDSAKANLHDMEVAARDRPAIDEEQLTAALGEETASVLNAARRAAAEMKERAEENVARMLREAAEEAGATRREADEAAARQREHLERLTTETEEVRRQAEVDAAATAERIRSEAQSAADAVRVAAESERRAAVEEAEEVRAEAQADAERTRSEAAEVLGVRTAEAEEAADAIRALGESDATTTREAGEADAAAARAQGEADREASREEGREMVAEATRVRERMLADLSRRRKTARVQLEQLQAARDRLLESYAAVQRTIDEATSGLRTSLADARTAAEVARVRAEGEPAATVGQLEAQITAARAAGLPLVAPADEPPAGEDVVDVTDALAQVEAADEDVEADSEALLVEADGAHGVEAVDDEAVDEVAADEGAEDVTEAAAAAPDQEVALVGAADETSETVGEVDAPDLATGEESADDDTEGVDELFARLKASQGTEASGEPAPEGAAADVVAGPETGEESTSPAVAEAHGDTAAGSEAEAAVLLGLLERRDGAIDPIEHRIARKLKRALADEQGSVLDHVRRERGRVELDSVLPAETQVDAYALVVRDELLAAAEEGAGFEGAPLPSATSVEDLAHDLARDLAAVVRPKVERCFDAGDDADDTSDRLRATYREWKTDRLVEVTRHHVLAAFGRGQAAVRAVGEPVRWVADPASPACPDCEDDALAGVVPSGEPFPTGHLHPPAHPGCRCLLVGVRVATPA